MGRLAAGLYAREQARELRAVAEARSRRVRAARRAARADGADEDAAADSVPPLAGDHWSKMRRAERAAQDAGLPPIGRDGDASAWQADSPILSMEGNPAQLESGKLRHGANTGSGREG